jgi:hypothetical protein
MCTHLDAMFEGFGLYGPSALPKRRRHVVLLIFIQSPNLKKNYKMAFCQTLNLKKLN